VSKVWLLGKKTERTIGQRAGVGAEIVKSHLNPQLQKGRGKCSNQTWKKLLVPKHHHRKKDRLSRGVTKKSVGVQGIP